MSLGVKNMGLQEEINEMRQNIRADGYAMSIGEWISLYENEEIDIHPEFQRFFRWSSYQKTSLIESILLGIPLPPIFVFQREDGIWDVIDGLQRLSTIYEFVGKLKNEDREIRPPLVLEETKYLPSLKGKKWEDPYDINNSFTQIQRLLIKRAKIDVTILLKESDEMAKYELFQRLNTGGSSATPQEVRNCILVMYDKKMFKWLKELSQDENFKECTALSDRPLQEQYDMELVLRFVIFRNLKEASMKGIGYVGNFLTDKMVEIATGKIENFEFEEEKEAFRATFKILNQHLGSNSFHRYSPEKQKFLGGFLLSAYEVIALGIGYNYAELSGHDTNICEKVKKVWQHSKYTEWSGSGTTAERRIPNLLPLGRRMFKP